MTPSPSPSRSRIALVLGGVCLFWGSTAPAMKVAIATLPPFLMVAIRFLAGGLILWFVARTRGVPLPRRREWGGAFVTTMLLLVGSNALFCWSLLVMPSGLGSLFFALSPLWIALFAAVLDRERISAAATTGLVLGLAGMLVIYAPLAGGTLPPWAIAVDAFCSITWALGSIVQRRFASTDLLQTSAMQMLLAAPVCFAIALALHERIVPGGVSAESLAGLAYLVVFGSVAGFSGYLWLMPRVPTTLATTYAYVNPLVAIAIGTLFLRESLSWSGAVGAAVVVTGVATMILAARAAPREA